jgi:hypothetical protein
MDLCNLHAGDAYVEYIERSPTVGLVPPRELRIISANSLARYCGLGKLFSLTVLISLEGTIL